MFYVDVLKSLKRNGVRCAVAGGIGTALHGAVRGTVDLDLVLVLTELNLKKAEKTLYQLGLKSRLPITASDIISFRNEYIKKRNLIAWNFVNPLNPSQLVDIIITHDLKKMKTKTFIVDGEKIAVISKQDLIKMKQLSGRPQDLEDIRALREV